MRRIWSIFIPFLALAQNQPDALPLLRQVAEALRNAKTIQVEGGFHLETQGRRESETLFKWTASRPLRYRFERTGSAPAWQISDGKTLWSYDPSTKLYSSQSAPTSEPLAPFFPPIESVSAATIEGEEILTVVGKRVACVIVRVTMRGAPAAAGPTTRFWIERDRKALRRTVVITGTRSRLDLTFTRFDLDQPVAGELFVFQPPDGSTKSVVPLAEAVEINLPGRGVLNPELRSKKEPAYSDEARAATLEGTVVLRITVSPNGVPADLRVTRSLGLGLD